MQILKATLEERLDSKENESREKLKFLEEAKKLMGTEFENLSAKIFDTKAAARAFLKECGEKGTVRKHA